MQIRSFCTTWLGLFLIGWTCLAVADEGQRYAIVVGVEKYDHSKLDRLEFAEDDAEALATLFGKVGYKVSLLCDTVGEKNKTFAPTKANIEAALASLLSKTKRQDTVVVALMGHGLNFVGQTDSFFCPQDARPIATETNTLVSLGKVYQQLDDCGAGVKVLLVDACRNDPDPARGRGIDADTAPLPPQGVAVLFSCSRGERAYEHKSLNHGIFTHFLLQGLRGAARDTDGEVTFETLAGYVKKQTARTVPSLLGLGRQQSPNLKADLSGIPPVLLSTQDLKLLSTSETPKLEFTNSVNMQLKLIPSGEFMMGNDESVNDLMKAYPNAKREWFTDAYKQHRVHIGKPFYMGIHEVTVGQFRQFVNAAEHKTDAEKDGKGGYGYDVLKKASLLRPEFNWRSVGWPQTDNHPVVNVSWNDAHAFCAWLSRQEGVKYRLPTEAEWEYACRAGTQTRYWHGNDPEGLIAIGNTWDAGTKEHFPKAANQLRGNDGHIFTAPVGRFAKNNFGLYDMTGNVREWCQDWYDSDYYDRSPYNDPLGPTAGTARVDRGGGWGSDAANCRSAVRDSDSPESRSFVIGFRVVREVHN